MITKDNIYVNKWNPTCMYLPQLPKWNNSMINNYENYHVEYISNIDNINLNKILNKMLAECIYENEESGLPKRVVRKIKDNINTYYINRLDNNVCPYCSKSLINMKCPKCQNKYVKDNLLLNIPDEEPDTYGIFYRTLYFNDDKWYLLTKVFKINYITKEREKDELKLISIYSIKEDGIYNEITDTYAYKIGMPIEYYLNSYVYYIDYKNAPKEILENKDTLDDLIKDEKCINLFRIIYNTYFSSNAVILRKRGLLKMSYDERYFFTKQYKLREYNIIMNEEELQFGIKYNISYQELLRYKLTDIHDYKWIKATTGILKSIFINFEGINMFNGKRVKSDQEYLRYQNRINNYFTENEHKIYNYFKSNNIKLNKENIKEYLIEKIKEKEV